MSEKTKEHECDPDEIEWDNDSEFDDKIYFEGRCPLCGKEYECIYTYTGIWDKSNTAW